MAHKSKTCVTALAHNVDVCFPHSSFIPLLANFRVADNDEPGKLGLQAAIDADVAANESTAPLTQESLRNIELMSKSVLDVASREASLALGTSVQLDASVRAAIERQLTSSQERALVERERSRVEQAIKKLGIAADARNPHLALQARMTRISESLQKAMVAEAKPMLIDRKRACAIPQLGMFFDELTCFRCEGLAYAPCGHESSLLPSEKIESSRTLDVSQTASSSTSTDTSVDITQTAKDTWSDEFVNSYDEQIKTELDLKHAIKASVKGTFKLLDFDLGSDSSLDFKRLVDRTRKASSKLTRESVREAVRKHTLSRKDSYQTLITVTEKTSTSGSMSNTGSRPQHAIERSASCVHTVMHKRIGVRLAWTGCIDNPGRGLCTPDNLEQKLSGRIQAIRDKWKSATPPSEFGSRPPNQRLCTPIAGGDRWGRPFGDNVEFLETVQASIPAGFGYVAGSASVEVTYASTSVVSTSVASEPSAGATGLVSLGIKIVVDNKLAHQEKIQFRVCFDMMTPEAAQFDARVAEWRSQQAQAEINALLTEERKQLAAFLLSDRVAAQIERVIFETFFGYKPGVDCCKLHAMIHGLFDFSSLAFVLRPNWVDFATGCQRNDPVTIFTAQCLSFYLPIKPGKEEEAIALLTSVQVLPNDPLLWAQLAGYITEIVRLRETVFDRQFDPTGWEPKLDGPHGYNLTPYDTAADVTWDAAFESNLNYQLIDAYVIATPCGGSRRDLRGDLCPNDKLTNSG